MKDANNKYSYTAKSGKTYTAYVYGSYVYYLTGESGSGSDVDTLLVKSVGDYQKMDSGVETKVYFEDGTEKVINVKTVVVPTTGFDQEDYDKDNTESVNKADVYREDGKTSYYKALNNPTNIASVLTADTLYAYEQDGSDYTPVSYTHLDVYKRQILYMPSHHIRYILYVLLPAGYYIYTVKNK